jgi:endo-1,4-beta-xylanase
MIVGRRGLLGLLAAPMLLAAAGGRSVASKGLPMADRGSGRLGFGTCVAPGHVEGDPRLRMTIEQLCSNLTPEYQLQWSSLEPEPGVYRFRPVDAIVGYAARRGMKMTGHALLWEQGTPGWGTPDWVRSRLAERPEWSLVRQRFETVLTRYRDVIPLWTVVNEPIDTSYRADGLRASVFLEAFGPGYIAEALETAREFAPAAQLMINEFSLEYENPVDQARRRAVLGLLEGIRRRGLPLDAFGIQGHLDLGKGRMSGRSLGKFLQNVADLGLDIHVTELDVQERDPSLSIDERDRRVADETARFLDIVLDQEAVTSVTAWGMSDKHSWLRSNPNGVKGTDSSINRGLPFDERVLPKPMAHVISQALGLALPVI